VFFFPSQTNFGQKINESTPLKTSKEKETKDMGARITRRFTPGLQVLSTNFNYVLLEVDSKRLVRYINSGKRTYGNSYTEILYFNLDIFPLNNEQR
jgi:hypothetical protein